MAAFATNVFGGPYDVDNDGYNDSAGLSAVWIGDQTATNPVHFSVTLEYANTTFIESNTSTAAIYIASIDQTFVSANSHMGLSNPPATCLARDDG